MVEPHEKDTPTPYDSALKTLFSHPEMMKALIEGFVPDPWVKDLDFSVLQPFPTEHITEDYKQDDISEGEKKTGYKKRLNDKVWKLKFKGEWLYVICLLEFQSSNYFFMAVRLLTYVGLIYQDLLKQKDHQEVLIQGCLPPIFSLVFYNGDSPWTAPTQLKGCLSKAIPESLAKYQPNIEYMVVDIGHLGLKEEVIPKENLVLPLIAIDKAKTPEEVVDIYRRLAIRLKGPQFDEIRRSFLQYVNRILKLPKDS